VRFRRREQAGLEVSVSKIVGDDALGDRRARVVVEGAGLVVAAHQGGASALLDDAARRVLSQLKTAGVRGRVRVEFQIETDGGVTRDSRPGAVRKLARGEPVGASPSGASGGAGRAPAAAGSPLRRLRRRTGTAAEASPRRRDAAAESA